LATPHILLITADQLRKDALGCYGGEVVRTPNLDRIAASGDRYERAYTASPWCLPSRSSILTGQMPHTHGSYSNFRDNRLRLDYPNLYALLGQEGYTTTHAGKCHYAPVPYGETRPDRTLPYEAFHAYYRSLGIDVLHLQDDKQVSVWFSDDYSQDLEAAGHLEAYRDAIWNRDVAKVFPFPGPAEWHPDSWVGHRAVDLIRGHASSRPLFTWISFSGPHFPFDAPDDHLDRVDRSKIGEATCADGEFDDARRIHHESFHGPSGIEGAGVAPGNGTSSYDPAYWTDLRTRYFANVALIDDQVGAILDAVDECLGDNVLILFTADHGEMLGHHRLWGKHNCAYQDVLNVPFLIRHPGQAEAAVLDQKISLLDILPTCLAVAGGIDTFGEGRALRQATGHDGYDHVIAEGEGFLAVVGDHDTWVCATVNGERRYEYHDRSLDPGETLNLISDPDCLEGVNDLQRIAVDALLGAALP
jgi:arylsulfatase A-like enzyme